jgi:hypothetical protein
VKSKGRIARLVAVLVVGVTGAVLAGPATPAHALQCYDGWLKSSANGKYVSAELQYTGIGYGELRARSTSVGSWERFELCWGVGGIPQQLAIRSLANGKWVASEQGYSEPFYGMLRARSSSIGPWETFHGGTGLRSLASLKFVSAELGYAGGRNGMLRARASALGPWEEFTNPGPFPAT